MKELKLDPARRGPEVSAPLERGRACFERREWDDAYVALSAADQSAPLAAEDLHRLAWSAALTARDEEMLALQERLYHAHLEARRGPCGGTRRVLAGVPLARARRGRAGRRMVGSGATSGRPGGPGLRRARLPVVAGRPEASERGRVSRSARRCGPRRGVR